MSVEADDKVESACLLSSKRGESYVLDRLSPQTVIRGSQQNKTEPQPTLASLGQPRRRCRNGNFGMPPECDDSHGIYDFEDVFMMDSTYSIANPHLSLPKRMGRGNYGAMMQQIATRYRPVLSRFTRARPAATSIGFRLLEMPFNERDRKRRGSEGARGSRHDGKRTRRRGHSGTH